MLNFNFSELNVINCVLSAAQSSEKGDILNPLITGVFLEVCVLAHKCMHAQMRAHTLAYSSLSPTSGVQQCVLHPGCLPAAQARPGDLPHPEEI